MSVVNAFNWKAYTDAEIARRGDPFAEVKRSANISAATTAGVHRLRKKNPSHGTLHGMSSKPLNIREPDMMEMKNAKGKGTKRNQRAADR